MKKILLFLIIGFATYSICAQSTSDTIIMKKLLGGYVFYQNGHVLKINQLFQAAKINEASYKEMEIAKTNYFISMIFGGVGGAMIGWQTGTYAGGGDPNWNMAIIGVGVACLGIPFSRKYSKHVKKAVEYYNDHLVKGSASMKKEFTFALTGNGAGLFCKF